MLKSDGFASNIYDPENEFPLGRFCAEQGIEYSDTEIPVRLDTFAAYGRAFQNRMVPDLEERLVVALDRVPEGFRLDLETGESVVVQQVVLAIGITHFAYIPTDLAHLSPDYLSHSYNHHKLDSLRGRKVVVVGAGSSALDLAGLLHDAGSDVSLVARAQHLRFHSKPTGKPRSLWQQIRHPKSGLGPGLRSRFFANSPGLFYHLPQGLRLEAVRKTLGPSGGWFIKDKVVGRLPLLLGQSIKRADVRDGKVLLQLRADDGSEREIEAEKVIAATGYKVDVDRLAFLSPAIRSSLKAIHGSPILSSSFESSVPGMYFVGVAAANSFGPVMRFAFGAGFAAERVTRALARSASLRPAMERTPAAVTSPE